MWMISTAPATQVSERDRSAASCRGVRAWSGGSGPRLSGSAPPFFCVQSGRICACTASPTGPGRYRRRRRRFPRRCPSRRSVSTSHATACNAATGSPSSPSTPTRGSSPSPSSSAPDSTPTTGTICPCTLNSTRLVLLSRVECLFFLSSDCMVLLTSIFAFFGGLVCLIVR